MILECPACQARYLVPAAHFIAGPRQVRCARCRHDWQAEQPADPAAAIAAQLADFTPPPAEPAPIPAGSNLPALPVPAWQKWIKRGNIVAIASIILVTVLLGAVLGRREVARAFPWTDAVFEYIGLHIYHTGEGLSLEQVRSEMRFDGGALRLVVEGHIHNNTKEKQSIPDIRADAIGPDGQSMENWQIAAPAATVAPAASVPFQSIVKAPGGTPVEINLSFIEPVNAR